MGREEGGRWEVGGREEGERTERGGREEGGRREVGGRVVVKVTSCFHTACFGCHD